MPGRRDVLRVHGEVDVVVAQELALELGVADWELGRTLARPGVREVDLTRATFVDSAMVAVLVAIAPHLPPDAFGCAGPEAAR
ncbi:hypothetical protein [Cellulomonas pakistanensis]|uniref:STAS domain-containing protein n=1 Tax=Cellulomonas pakistanensis TaxID=992287 RepID=A0A919P8A7_9CELL|nr:hypothetical protein [Cellulomonas pakistanensis]GIG34726.1 hypothetical protein Cpa01nite_01070 [Cellulomonas pakistanensis]